MFGYLFICLDTYLFVWILIYSFGYLFICLDTYLFVWILIYLFGYLFICLDTYLFLFYSSVINNVPEANIGFYLHRLLDSYTGNKYHFLLLGSSFKVRDNGFLGYRLHGVTWGLHRVTWGYMGVQGVTWEYKGLH